MDGWGEGEMVERETLLAATTVHLWAAKNS